MLLQNTAKNFKLCEAVARFLGGSAGSQAPLRGGRPTLACSALNSASVEFFSVGRRGAERQTSYTQWSGSPNQSSILLYFLQLRSLCREFRRKNCDNRKKLVRTYQYKMSGHKLLAARKKHLTLKLDIFELGNLCTKCPKLMQKSDAHKQRALSKSLAQSFKPALATFAIFIKNCYVYTRTKYL